MRDTQPYKEVKIEITFVEFKKAGSISFVGIVEGVPLVITWDATMKDFEKILPGAEARPGELKDQDDLYNAALDDHNNLHWLIKHNGNLFQYVIWLAPIIKDELFEAYIKTR